MNSPASSSLAHRVLAYVLYILKILLTPARLLSDKVFPLQDTDGLTLQATSKAAQRFVSDICKAGTSCSDHWSTTGFAQAKQLALQNKSLLILVLHSPLQTNNAKLMQSIAQLPDQVNENSTSNTVWYGVSVHTAQGAQLAQLLHVSCFPVIAVLQPASASALQLALRVEGSNVLESMLQQNALQAHLRSTLRLYQHQLAEQEAQRIYRQQESDLRRQQDEEYQQALQADRERERLEEQKQFEEAKKQREIEEQEQLQQQEMQQARDLVKASQQTMESGDPGLRTTTIRLTLPHGTRLTQRFPAHDTIATIRAFLKVHFHDNDIQIQRFSLSTSFPKQTFEEDCLTLEAAGLVPQAVLMVQDMDA